MAASLPTKLRTPDIQRFAKRAAQLEKFKPIITYWCEYYILQQILSKQLHAADEDTSNYAVQLMDKLENVKAENPANDAIIDDVAAKAYVENFALETFSRADEAQRTNKVTIQTADTFQAASTFMDLLSIWGELDVEVSAKIKFAKFHAMRIVKAVKAGEDPNASNPVIEEPPAPSEEGLEAELNGLEQQEVAGAQDTYRAPTVEAAPDGDGGGTDIENAGGFTGATAAPSSDPGVAPLGGPTDGLSSQNNMPGAPRQGSIGGGYFPAVPSAPSVADVDVTDTGAIASETVPSQPTEQPQDFAAPQDFYNQAAISSPPPTTSAGPPHLPSQAQSAAQPRIIESSSYVPPAAVPPPAPMPAAQTQHAAPPPVGAFRTDDESTMAAQKHAKWAISALNFEDVNTAVKELRLALQSLGAA